jgi:carboxymethylenebutenolidase
MRGRDEKIDSRDGGQFDCYLASPERPGPFPGLVLASAIHGVDDDLRSLADEFASKDVLVAAPDMFWRSVPGPLLRGDARAARRAQPRHDKIRAGEANMADMLTFMRTLPNFSGRAAVMGFCYGGPYALIGPRRLGYSAGLSCHGSDMLDYIGEANGLTHPVHLLWGDQDDRAPADVLDRFSELAQQHPREVRLHIFPGVRHGYMMRGNRLSFDGRARDETVACALGVLETLRSPAL